MLLILASHYLSAVSFTAAYTAPEYDPFKYVRYGTAARRAAMSSGFVFASGLVALAVFAWLNI